METLSECAKLMPTDDFHIPLKEKNGVDHWVVPDQSKKRETIQINNSVAAPF
jgi:hypothetical protein